MPASTGSCLTISASPMSTPEIRRCEWWRWDGCTSKTGQCEWPKCPTIPVEHVLDAIAGQIADRSGWVTAREWEAWSRRLLGLPSWPAPKTNPPTTEVERTTVEP